MGAQWAVRPVGDAGKSVAQALGVLALAAPRLEQPRLRSVTPDAVVELYTPDEVQSAAQSCAVTAAGALQGAPLAFQLPEGQVQQQSLPAQMPQRVASPVLLAVLQKLAQPDVALQEALPEVALER